MVGAPPPADPTMETPPIGAVPPAVESTAGPPVPPTPPPRKRVGIAVAAVVVVVILLVGILVFTGALSSPGTGSGTTGTPFSFSQTSPAGEAAAMNATGGPWTVIGAEGIGLSATISISNLGSLVESGCTYTPACGSSLVVTFAGTPSGTATGEVATWLFIATNESGDALFIVSTGGSALPAIVATGSCTSSFAGFGSIVGLPVIDSTVVGAYANANGGSAFLQAHSGAMQAYVLLGPSGSTLNEPFWGVEYSTCGLTATSGPGTMFVAAYYADTGAALGSPQTQSVTC